MMENAGILTLSLDFELLWGVFDKVNWREKKVYFQNTRAIIPDILQLFEKYDIHCTWATVGMLFNQNWDDWNSNIPNIPAHYNDQSLSAYNYGQQIQSKETEEICFAPNLIRRIKEIPFQEIGTHTYSHYYCKEEGQNLQMFRADLEKAILLAKRENIELKSIVFPRNQINSEYLKVCRKSGLNSFRSNPDAWYWSNPEEGTFSQKLFRTGDAYVGPTDKSYSLKDMPSNLGYTLQKSSRMLRPPSNYQILEKLKLNRIKTELKKAAINREVYHLWWHPHNFGSHPAKSIDQLRAVLEYFHLCRLKYNMRSCNMLEINSLVNSNLDHAI